MFKDVKETIADNPRDYFLVSSEHLIIADPYFPADSPHAHLIRLAENGKWRADIEYESTEVKHLQISHSRYTGRELVGGEVYFEKSVWCKVHSGLIGVFDAGKYSDGIQFDQRYPKRTEHWCRDIDRNRRKFYGFCLDAAPELAGFIPYGCVCRCSPGSVEVAVYTDPDGFCVGIECWTK